MKQISDEFAESKLECGRLRTGLRAAVDKIETYKTNADDLKRHIDELKSKITQINAELADCRKKKVN